MRLVLAVMVCVICSGCFVIDEIDKGQELMEAHSPDTEKVATDPALSGADGEAASARNRLNAYYKKQRSKASAAKSSDDPHDAVGRCKLGSNTLFMRQADCVSRGGTFL
jgi:hypothetical protein